MQSNHGMLEGLITEIGVAAGQAKREKKEARKRTHEEVASPLDRLFRVSFQLAAEPGASSWLSVTPNDHMGHQLPKQDFRDGIAIRYGFLPTGVTTTCVCAVQP